MTFPMSMLMGDLRIYTSFECRSSAARVHFNTKLTVEEADHVKASLAQSRYSAIGAPNRVLTRGKTPTSRISQCAKSVYQTQIKQLRISTTSIRRLVKAWSLVLLLQLAMG